LQKQKAFTNFPISMRDELLWRKEYLLCHRETIVVKAGIV